MDPVYYIKYTQHKIQQGNFRKYVSTFEKHLSFLVKTLKKIQESLYSFFFKNLIY